MELLNCKKCIILALLLFSASNIFMSELRSQYLIIFFYALLNLAYSLYSVVLKVVISDAEKINKSRLFSINYTMTNVGWVIGPLLGSLCSGLDGRIMFWISGVIGVLLASFFILYKVRLIEEKQLTKNAQYAPV
ncbi:TPA: MFS transporter, partial [Klebsiella pneumoniae]|nr:MFS transporter [Klebsiella pneumoniae]